jgi:AcrR family transcriptional regulator
VTPEAPSSRRIGAEDSVTRAQLLDAAERLMLEDGYAAVTSRRVAAAAGLKPQLVHYYFRTMDDLFVAMFRRRAEDNLAAFERSDPEARTLRWLWQVNADPRRANFMIEFVALANHRKAIRAELADYSERWRAIQIEALRRGLARAGVSEDELPATAAMLLMTGLAQVLGIEGAIGIDAGHAEAVAFVEREIDRLEQQG